MKVLVTGVTGQLGYDVAKELEKRHIEYKGVGSRDMDLTNADEVHRVITDYHPDAIIHCAAYTAVDKAEDEYEKCMSVNSDGTIAVAEAAEEIGAKLVYISTDYVFEGQGNLPFETTDEKVPLNMYGLSKLFGEQAVQMISSRYFIVRISWVFGVNGNNFVKTMLRLGKEKEQLTVVSDQWGSPTYTADLAPLLCDMIETEKYGVYHATNEGITNWAAFAAVIMKEANLPCKIIPITSDQYPTKAVRPHNSRLSKKSLDEAGFKRLPDWHDALKRYIGEIAGK
jgi:dTDP-4-dehydrorhamnose reductase